MTLQRDEVRPPGGREQQCYGAYPPTTVTTMAVVIKACRWRRRPSTANGGDSNQRSHTWRNVTLCGAPRGATLMELAGGSLQQTISVWDHRQHHRQQSQCVDDVLLIRIGLQEGGLDGCSPPENLSPNLTRGIIVFTDGGIHRVAGQILR